MLEPCSATSAPRRVDGLAVGTVSIVGTGIHARPATRPGCSARSSTPGINIELISTSDIRITTLIAEDRVEEAVRALHAAFELEQPETVETAGAVAG